jgi:small subunit ribosomal protein SAe
MRGTLAGGQAWDVVVDLFFYREPEETKEDGEEAAADAFGGVAEAGGYGGAAGLPAPQGALPPAGSSMQAGIF